MLNPLPWQENLRLCCSLEVSDFSDADPLGIALFHKEVPAEVHFVCVIFGVSVWLFPPLFFPESVLSLFFIFYSLTPTHKPVLIQKCCHKHTREMMEMSKKSDRNTKSGKCCYRLGRHTNSHSHSGSVKEQKNQIKIHHSPAQGQKKLIKVYDSDT